MGLLNSPNVKKIRILQIQDSGRLPFWKPLHQPISATFWMFLIKIGTVMHDSPIGRFVYDTYNN